MERDEIENRDVYIVNGRISQTVNVCTFANERRKYVFIVRLTPQHFVTKADVEAQPNIDLLIAWLKGSRLGLIKQYPMYEGREFQSKASDSMLEAPPIDSDDARWIERAMRIAEISIDELVREFLDLPYLHRVEHSIHTSLYAILRSQPHFDRHFPLGKREMFTQPIHKEWPESIPRPEKGNRRGIFDLAILSPNRIRNAL